MIFIDVNVIKLNEIVLHDAFLFVLLVWNKKVKLSLVCIKNGRRMRHLKYSLKVVSLRRCD